MQRLPLLLQILFISLLSIPFAAASCEPAAPSGEIKYSKDACNTNPAFVVNMRENESQPTDRSRVPRNGKKPTIDQRRKTDFNANPAIDPRRQKKVDRLQGDVECAPASAYGREFTIAPPRRGELVLHVASDFTGYYFLNVYGLSGGEKTPLTECLTSRAIHQIVHVPMPSGKVKFDKLLIDIRYQSGKVLDTNPKDAFISISAFDGAPATSEESAKKGFREDCDDGGTNCYVLSTCDRGMNLEEWAKELGLKVLDEAGSEGRMAVNACVPEGFSVQTTRPTSGGKVKVIERDTTTGDMERNFFIELEETTPNPGYGEIDDKQIIAAFPCMEYEPRNGSGKDLMITIIDSGVDASDLSFRPWDKYAARRDYGTYLGANTYGYDFINNDPTPNDELNHGTYVGGALIADYKGDDRLTVVHHKIFDGRGRATYFGAIESVYAAIEHQTNILSLSWGITDEKEPLALRCALQEAMKQKIIVVASAGNASTDIDGKPQWPAGWSGQREWPFLLSVGSYWYPNLNDVKTMRAEYSNFGEKRVSYYGYLTMLVPDYQATNTILAFGTSISVPLVVANIAERYSAGAREQTRPTTRPESGGQFFPNWMRDAGGNPISPHEVQILHMDCAGGRP